MTRITSLNFSPEFVVSVVEEIAKALATTENNKLPDMRDVHALLSTQKKVLDAKSMRFLHTRVDELDRNVVAVVLADVNRRNPFAVFDALLTTRERGP